MPIIDLQRRLHEAGRIRIGERAVARNGKSRPARLETFRITSQSRRLVEAAAAAWGGVAEPWADSPVGEQWQVVTHATTIPVIVPPEQMAFSQFYELWSGGGCQRRCDGQWEMVSERPCPCDPESRECGMHTRLSVIAADLPGSGLLRLDTQGFYAATELGGAFELARMIAAASGRSMVPAVLSLQQREVKRPGQPVKRFAVPVLDFDLRPALAPAAPASEVEAAGVRPVTPVPAISPPKTLAAELREVEEPRPRAQRVNGAEPIRRTGLRPRPRTAPEPEPADEVGPRLVTDAQLRKLHAVFGDLGCEDREDRLRVARALTGRPDLGSSRDLTVEDASRLIDQVESFLLEVDASVALWAAVERAEEYAALSQGVGS